MHRLLVVVLVSCGAACSKTPERTATPSPAAAAPSSEIHTLSSRGDATLPRPAGGMEQPSSAAELPAGNPPMGSLPSGHPPIGSLPAGHPPADGGTGQGGAAVAGPKLAGTVRLAPSVQKLAAPTDVLYFVARSTADGSVGAVRRIDNPQFPVTFELSAADSMGGTSTLAGPFDVTARLSKGGDAFPTAGDLEGVARGIRPGGASFTVVIDTVRK